MRFPRRSWNIFRATPSEHFSIVRGFEGDGGLRDFFSAPEIVVVDFVERKGSSLADASNFFFYFSLRGDAGWSFGSGSEEIAVLGFALGFF